MEALRLFALEFDWIIRYIRTDNEFITSTTTAWAASHKILFIPSIPHEHTVRSVEQVHRMLQEMVVKSLALKPHLSPAFWGLSYLHRIDILNIISNATSSFGIITSTPTRRCIVRTVKGSMQVYIDRVPNIL